MSQWDYKIDQPMPGPFPFPNLRKGPGIEVEGYSDPFARVTLLLRSLYLHVNRPLMGRDVQAI